MGIIYDSAMKLIVGLGNPGKEYAQTRHNVGFQFLDALREALGFAEFQESKKFSALITEGSTEKLGKIILAKPLTFMNASGEAVSKLLHFYHCAPIDLCVIYDDIDLRLGKGRYRFSGSAGTHNGMKSIVESLGTENFPRIRFGIESRGGRAGAEEGSAAAPKEQDLTSFVLHPFSEEEKPLLLSAFQKVVNVYVSGKPFPESFSW